MCLSVVWVVTEERIKRIELTGLCTKSSFWRVFNKWKGKDLEEGFMEQLIKVDAAFDQAIKDGRLSRDRAAANYAGNYMYMGTDDSGKDLFKNSCTRQYDV